MKKSFIVTMAILVALLIASPGMATTAVSTGNLDTSLFASPVGIDGGFTTKPGAAAGGFAIGSGVLSAGAHGLVYNGEVSADLSGSATGLAASEAAQDLEFGINMTDGSTIPGFMSTIGSASTAISGITIDADILVDPALYGFGMIGAGVYGVTSELTFDFSNMTLLGGMYETDGITGGTAGQGAFGSLNGTLFAMSYGDYECGGHFEYVGAGEQGDPGYYSQKVHPDHVQNFRNGIPGRGWNFLGTGREWVPYVIDRNDDASLNASIDITGHSYSQSYRFAGFGDGFRVEGLGTSVGANTTVTTDFETSGDASVRGSYAVEGGAAAQTVQSAPGTLVSATTFGQYAGAGVLGTNYSGSAIGYTNTSIVNVTGMNGSMVSASTGMTVTSTSNSVSQ